MSRFLFAFCVVLVLAGITFINPARAEFDVRDDALTASDFIHECDFATIKDSTLPPYCEGVLRSIMTLVHSGKIRDLMNTNQCIDLSAYIPDWRTPVIETIVRHAKEANATQDIFDFIVQALTEDYPCTAKNPDASPMTGTRALKP